MYAYEVYAYEVHVHEVHDCEMHVYKIHTHEMHACEVHAHEIHAYEVYALEIHAYEGFYEDLVRQSTAARLPQRQLGPRRRHIWVSVWSHMGFSHRRSILEATI